MDAANAAAAGGVTSPQGGTRERRVWLVGGTSEGRQLAEALAQLGVHVYVSVATEYGAALVAQDPHITVMQKRLTGPEMVALLRDLQPELVVDATHPYATIVTETVRAACAEAQAEYLRLVRPESVTHDHQILVQSFDEAVELLSHTEGNIFLTTGSKNLPDFTKLPDFEKRIALRILPMVDSLQTALDCGYERKNIICMQGPFSTALNVAMWQQYGTKYVVTKDSGKVGGFDDKLEAVRALGLTLIVIARKEETGSDYNRVVELLTERFGE